MPRPQQPPVPESLIRGMRGETDPRGFLVTHVVHRDDGGTPVMGMVDAALVSACMSERRCQSCGCSIGEDEWVGFIGPIGARLFEEAPIHLECAHYSFQACPHLLRQTRVKAIEIVVCKRYSHLPAGGSSGRDRDVCLPLFPTDRQDVADLRRRNPSASGVTNRLAPEGLGPWLVPACRRR